MASDKFIKAVCAIAFCSLILMNTSFADTCPLASAIDPTGSPPANWQWLPGPGPQGPEPLAFVNATHALVDLTPPIKAYDIICTYASASSVISIVSVPSYAQPSGPSGLWEVGDAPYFLTCPPKGYAPDPALCAFSNSPKLKSRVLSPK